MPDIATSLHLHNVHELMILVPLRKGFVQTDERRISYAGRLQRLLSLLFRPAQSTSEKSLIPVLNFSEDLSNLYNFNYGVVDRYQQSELILSATFDSSFETYFDNLVYNVGDFLDAVFFHCEGFEGRSCKDGYEAFAGFIREHQIQTGMMYTATPDMTVQDLRLAKRISKRREGEPLIDLKKEIEEDKKDWTARYASKAWQGPDEYKRLRLQGIEQFFLSGWEARKLFPSKEKELVAGRGADEFFDAAFLRLLRVLFADREFGIDEVVRSLHIHEDRQQAWVGGLIAKLKPQPLPPVVLDSEKAPALFRDVQDGIVAPADSHAAQIHLLRLPANDPATFLANIYKTLAAHEPGIDVNVGFTFAGLRRLGLGNETLELLPKEFQEGMELRAGVLGDLGWPNHPEYWRPIGKQGWFSLSSIDMVVVFHCLEDCAPAKFDAVCEAYLDTWLDADLRASCIVHSEELSRPQNGDAFGLKALKEKERGQPVVRVEGFSNDSSSPSFDNSIAVGDMILGYDNRRKSTSELTEPRTVFGLDGKKETIDDTSRRALFQNGTFLVVRKLAQNYRAFESFRKQEPVLGSEPVALGARPADGYPGTGGCIHARVSHLQRTNPRTRETPRIMRRSYEYAHPKDTSGGEGIEKGHMFMCFNASIAQQYEVIQRWINGGNSTGLSSAKSDLVAGQSVPYTVSNNDTESLPHTTVRWGLYLFVPSKPAIRHLADIAAKPRFGHEAWPFVKGLRDSEARLRKERGDKVIARIEALADRRLVIDSWKQLFEEPVNARDAQAVWASIRQSDEKERLTPYALLKASPTGVADVLEDTGERFSVREYGERFGEFKGRFYLGLDQNPEAPLCDGSPSYVLLARANELLNHAITIDDATAFATATTDAFLKDRPKLNLEELVREIVGQFCRQFTEIPSVVGAAELHAFLQHFINITRYSSFPYPEPWVKQNAFESGKALLAAYGTEPSAWTGKLARKLIEDHYPTGIDPVDRVAARDALIVANVGFVPPAISMLIGMLSKWLNNGDILLPRFADPIEARAVIVHELKSDPTFTAIYRAQTGESSVPALAGIQSAYVAEEEAAAARGEVSDASRWMFGGAYAKTGEVGRGAHACPMQPQALAIITAVVTRVAHHVQTQAAGTPRMALVRLSPFDYELEPITHTLPGGYWDPVAPADSGSLPPHGGPHVPSEPTGTALHTGPAKRED